MNRRIVTLLFVVAAAIAATPGESTSPASPHWAFQPLRDPAPPIVRHPDWCETSVDPFILSRLESHDIDPAPPADRRTLLRRASFDLTGLPPSASEIDAFVADTSPDAWSRVVDRLLDSPHYGEHWGRHWLDVVRYADTAGETADYPVPVAWRYRNYVIEAFNSDKPYDVFLREQIAGDILAREGPREAYAERVTATGFLALSRRFGFDSENYHHLTLQDTIDTLGQSVLGLTVGCARCHDHKYDPVPMGEYYALYGIFESTRFAFPGSEQKQRHRALVPLLPPSESAPQWRRYELEVATLTRWLEGRKQSVPSAVLRSLDELDGDFEMQAPAAAAARASWSPPGSTKAPSPSPRKPRARSRTRIPWERSESTSPRAPAPTGSASPCTRRGPPTRTPSSTSTSTSAWVPRRGTRTRFRLRLRPRLRSRFRFRPRPPRRLDAIAFGLGPGNPDRSRKS